MSDHDPFLAEIRSAPDDDGPRRIFADWLEEHGDRDRADFIRVQCALARRHLVGRERSALGNRERDLWEAHRDAWLAPFTDMVQTATFRRGTVEEVQLTAGQLRAHGEAVAGLATVFQAEVHGPWTGAEPVAFLQHLVGLTLVNPGVTDLTVRFIAQAPWAAGLRRLRLRNTGVGDGAAQQLAASPHLTRLAQLEITNADVGNHGAEALAMSPYLRSLEDLSLAYCRVFDPGARALLRTTLPNLRQVNLGANRLSPWMVNELLGRFGRGLRL